MKIFKKLKSKKSVSPIQTDAMTDTPLPDLKNSVTPLADLTPNVVSVIKEVTVDDEKLSLSKIKPHTDTAIEAETNSHTVEVESTLNQKARLNQEATISDTSDIVVNSTIEEISDTLLDNTSDNPGPPTSTEIAELPKPIVKDSKPAKIKLTGRMLSFTRLHITGSDIEQIKPQLNQKFAHQTSSKMLIVLSCEEQLDLARLLEHLWGLNLQPIGIVTGQMDEQAREHRLAIFPADGKRIDVLAEDKKVRQIPTPPVEKTIDTAVVEQQPSEKPEDHILQTSLTPNLVEATNTSETADTYISSLPQTSQLEGDLVYTTILRSGQSINHVGGDLILTQGINAGAEAITDYSLHVYGKAEGRLVAGATGDENARVFCLRFNPSLVSVAGTFCLRENIPNEFLDKAVQVSYERDKGLVFKLMNA